MKEGTFLRRMHPVLTPKLYFRISMIFYTALSTTGSQGAAQWSLDGSMGSYDVLQCHMKASTGAQVNWY